MLPARTVRDEVRWFEKCAHGVDVTSPCPQCQVLTGQGQAMFEPLSPEDILERDRDRKRDR